MRRSLLRLAAAGLAFTALAGAAGAAPARDATGSGALEAFAPDGAPLGACPLQHTRVSSEIAGFAARVTVTQVFGNPFPDPVEAVYTFPLSARGAVDAMRIRIGEREIRGELHRRDDARELYERARSDGRVAALLDQERPNVFTQRIANLMPGARVEVELEYSEPLAYENGGFEWSFPMVVGPRFVPGTPSGRSGTGRIPDTTRVPDASRITPPVAPAGARAGHDISLEVAIAAGISIRGLESRLHEIEVERPDPTRARVRLARRDEIPNRDFVLRYAVAADEVQSGVLTYRDDGDGYLTLFLVPPERVAPERASPKELVFVVDRSGSQSGLPLLKAKETMLWAIERLNPQDTFQIVSFGSASEVLFERPQPANAETKRAARRYLAGLSANGGTMMAEAVRRVAELPAEAGRLRVVTFMTDGYVGNDFEVIDLVRRLRGTSRWFPFGTGNSVNRFLLDEMARSGGGEVEYVLLNDDGDRVARRFYDRIRAPVLTDLQLDFRGVDVERVYPNELSDLWAGRPLVVHARYRSGGRGTVRLRGRRGGRAYEQSIPLELPERATEVAGIASLWARARVDALLAEDLRALQSGSFPAALQREVESVALEHRLLTQFTSFVAVEDRVVNEGGVTRRVTVPVELPHGVDREGALGARTQEVASVAYKTAPLQAGRSALRQLESRDRADKPAPAPLPLSEKARKKLAPKLVELLERRGAAAHPVFVVRVELRDLSARAIEALEAAGLRIVMTFERAVIGTVDLDALEAVAELDAVARVSRP